MILTLPTMPVFWRALLLSLVHPAAVSAEQPRSGACRPANNREEFGFALVGHDYKSFHADNFGRCFLQCSSDECQSVTFLWNTNECKLNKETKKSKPADFVENPAATYMENPFREKKEKKGSNDSVPGSSCKDILTSGDAQGDGEYWIDPTASGDPFTVFCDMATDGGGWLLTSRFIMKTLDSFRDSGIESDSYRTILPKYNSNKQALLRNGFNQLKQDMGFTQIRFYCFKKTTGRVFHIMTNNDAKGADVVTFFTSSDTMPEACGSFTRLPDDNSTLAVNCDKWGGPSSNRWGFGATLTDDRLFRSAMRWPRTYRVRFGSNHNTTYDCDDLGDGLSLGDVWQVFVR